MKLGSVRADTGIVTDFINNPLNDIIRASI